MKITVDIVEFLLREAQKRAAQEGVTLKALIERGLRLVIAEAKQRPPFKLRRAPFKGEGLSRDLQTASWEAVRDRVYKGRGS